MAELSSEDIAKIHETPILVERNSTDIQRLIELYAENAEQCNRNDGRIGRNEEAIQALMADKQDRLKWIMQILAAVIAAGAVVLLGFK